MSNNMPDYGNYTLVDLFQARDAINKAAYPERLVEIERLIQEKLSEPERTEAKEERLVSKYHTFWRRFLAMFVDSLALGIIYLVIFKLFNWLGWWAVPVALVFQYFYYLAYSIVCHGKFSRTLGKLVTSIIVLDAKTEKRISFKHAFLRDSIPLMIAVIVFSVAMVAYAGEGYLSEVQQNLAVWVGAFELVWLLLELATMLFNKKRRALHDFIGGTVVVKE